MEDLPVKLGINWPVLLTQIVTFIILLVILVGFGIASQ